MEKKQLSRRGFFGTLAAFFGVTALAANRNDELSPKELVRAWEDPEFRNSLTEAQWKQLPPNPAGKMESNGYSGNLYAQSADACSGNNCSGNNCSGNNCSGNNCSGNNCSGNNCSGNNCSGNSCSGNNCSGRSCSAYPCGANV